MKRFSKNPELTVKVYSRSNDLYHGEAFSVTASNKIGPLAILPGHANLISILETCTMVIDSPDGEKEMLINKGLIKVFSNDVVVFVDI